MHPDKTRRGRQIIAEGFYDLAAASPRLDLPENRTSRERVPCLIQTRCFSQTYLPTALHGSVACLQQLGSWKCSSGKNCAFPESGPFVLASCSFFIGCGQAWFDEHRNVATLIAEKANLSSRNNELTSQLAYKERPIEVKIDPSTLKAEPVKHSNGANASAQRYAPVRAKRPPSQPSLQGPSIKQLRSPVREIAMQQTPAQTSAQYEGYFGSAPHVNLPPPDGSLRVSQTEETSTRADAPNHTKVVVQTTKTFTSLKLVVECNRDIVDGRAEPSNGGAIMMSQQGTAQGHPNIFIAAYGSATPPFSPSNPWVFDLWSKGPIACSEAATF